jgi:hypothetical protein
MHRSGNFFDKNDLTKKEQLKFALYLYKELRHAEQIFLILRYTSSQGEHLFNSYGHVKEITAVAEFAKKFPITPDQEIAGLCMGLSATLNINSHELSLHNEKSEIGIAKKISTWISSRFLLHIRDATLAEKLVRRGWSKG